MWLAKNKAQVRSQILKLYQEHCCSTRRLLYELPVGDLVRIPIVYKHYMEEKEGNKNTLNGARTNGSNKLKESHGCQQVSEQFK